MPCRCVLCIWSPPQSAVLTNQSIKKGECIISRRRRSQVWHHTCDSHSMTSPAPHTHDVHMTKSRESHPHENIPKTIRSQGTKIRDASCDVQGDLAAAPLARAAGTVSQGARERPRGQPRKSQGRLGAARGRRGHAAQPYWGWPISPGPTNRALMVAGAYACTPRA